MWVRAPRVVELHARCVVEILARVTTRAPLRCPEINWGAKHPRPDAWEVAV